jgi:pimeloyl-ACP methyl ester carboxylesterase
VQDYRLHVRAWQHHFAAIFGLEALGRGARLSPAEMALPNHQPTQVVAPDNAEVLASLRPDDKLQRFDGADHLLYWEQPKRFVRIVTDFLTTLPQQRVCQLQPPAGPARKGERVRVKSVGSAVEF